MPERPEPANGEPNERDRQRRPGIRIDPSHLILEVISIVLAIILATGVNEWRDRRRDDDAAARALTAIRSEVLVNASRLRELRPLHRRIRSVFAALTRTAQTRRWLSYGSFSGTFGREAPNGVNPYVGESTAWDLARESRVLANIPYEKRVVLERAYAEQRFLNGYSDRLVTDLHFASDAVNPNAFFFTENFVLDLGDVIASEERLATDYDRVVQAVAGGPP